jgi:hypothetical protein
VLGLEFKPHLNLPPKPCLHLQHIVLLPEVSCYLFHLFFPWDPGLLLHVGPPGMNSVNQAGGGSLAGHSGLHCCLPPGKWSQLSEHGHSPLGQGSLRPHCFFPIRTVGGGFHCLIMLGTDLVLVPLAWEFLLLEKECFTHLCTEKALIKVC